MASHQVSAQWREYERTSTTVLSAYTQPVVASYLDSLAGSLRVAAIAQAAPPLAWPPDDPPPGYAPTSGSRLVDLDPYGATIQVPVLQRADLTTPAPGPCLIQEPAATTLVLPAQSAHRDPHGNLVIEEQ